MNDLIWCRSALHIYTRSFQSLVLTPAKLTSRGTFALYNTKEYNPQHQQQFEIDNDPMQLLMIIAIYYNDVIIYMKAHTMI